MSPLKLISKGEEIQTIVNSWKQQMHLTNNSSSFTLFHDRKILWECLGKEGACCFVNLPWCMIETWHACFGVFMSPGTAESARGKKKPKKYRVWEMGRRCLLWQDAFYVNNQKDLGYNCFNQLGRLVEYNSCGGFLAEVVFIGWV